MLYYLVVELATGKPVINPDTQAPFVYGNENIACQDYPGKLPEYPGQIKLVPITLVKVLETF